MIQEKSYGLQLMSYSCNNIVPAQTSHIWVWNLSLSFVLPVTATKFELRLQGWYYIIVIQRQRPMLILACTLTFVCAARNSYKIRTQVTRMVLYNSDTTIASYANTTLYKNRYKKWHHHISFNWCRNVFKKRF